MATARSLGYEVFQLGVPLARFVPHRTLAPGHTECYGFTLTDDWIKEEIGPAILKQLTTLLMLYQTLLVLMAKLDVLRKRKVGRVLGLADTRECIGHIMYGPDEEEK
jgi:hypothetical protein